MNTSELLNKFLDITGKIPYRQGFDCQSINTNILLIYLRSFRDINCPPNYNDHVIKQLQTLTEGIKKMENGIIGGNLEFLWLIGHLTSSKLIELTPFIWQMAYDIVSRNVSYVINSPYQVDFRSRFHAIGVAMMALHNKESNTLDRYIWEEQIIFKLCDCAKLLSESTIPVYEPKMLTAGILHSIIAFSDLAKASNIYPFKASQIKLCALNLKYNSLESNINDILILKLYKRVNISKDLRKMCVTDIYNFLAEVGALSIIYKQRNLFENALLQCDEIHPNLLNNPDKIPQNHLLGITIGLSSLIL